MKALGSGVSIEQLRQTLNQTAGRLAGDLLARNWQDSWCSESGFLWKPRGRDHRPVAGGIIAAELASSAAERGGRRVDFDWPGSRWWPVMAAAHTGGAAALGAARGSAGRSRADLGLHLDQAFPAASGRTLSLARY